jgi:HEAT repeat protein
LSLSESLDVLLSNKSNYKDRDLVNLSDLNEEDLNLFIDYWLNFDTIKRIEVLKKLTEISEHNLEVDFDIIFKLCLEDTDAEIRSIAIDGLWECEDRHLLDVLCKIMENDVSTEVRSSAALGVGKFATLCQNGKMLFKDQDRIIYPLLGVVEDMSEDLEVRRRAMESVSIFDTEEVHDIIQEAYQHENPEMRRSAVYSMGKNCDIGWLSIILEELDNNDPAMRYEACNACAELSEEEAVPYLIPLFEDEDLETQSAAIMATGYIGGKMAKNALMECQQSSDQVIVEIAQESLEILRVSEGSMDFGTG